MVPANVTLLQDLSEVLHWLSNQAVVHWLAPRPRLFYQNTGATKIIQVRTQLTQSAGQLDNKASTVTSLLTASCSTCLALLQQPNAVLARSRPCNLVKQRAWSDPTPEAQQSCRHPLLCLTSRVCVCVCVCVCVSCCAPVCVCPHSPAP
jgi:hypothetical protein